MQALCNVSMEEAKDLLANSRVVSITIETEGVTSEHLKQDDGRWTRDFIQSAEAEDDITWSEEEFAQFISDISSDCVTYTIRTEQ